MNGAADFLVSSNTKGFSTTRTLTEGVSQELVFLQPTYVKLGGTE